MSQFLPVSQAGIDVVEDVEVFLSSIETHRKKILCTCKSFHS